MIEAYCTVCLTPNDPVIGCNCNPMGLRLQRIITAMNILKESQVAVQEFDLASEFRDVTDLVRKIKNRVEET